MKILSKILCIVLVVFVVSACGYRGATHSSLIGNIKTVYVEEPKNSHKVPNLDVFLKQAIIKQLNSDPHIKVVSKKSDAQGYIHTDIINYSIYPSVFDKNGLARTYRCMITVNLTLTNKEGKALILNKTLTSFADFDASNDDSAIEVAKRSPQNEVLAKLAVLIREELFINF
ncbi:hypothetical protein DESAMIL20_1805 [Desulfurella amilsii]|uniref:Lipoprotein n=1 Tax=Desulfurella amilsii TaxID=1562698 RepID=A0A1X4XXI2_9BACT|nr:LPS assembly lipoprotein LptE [Desulfurella amilsii]OSS42252.1 hypothetical protein DESAMIL20_1805 [Desulfurella amilsii]